MSEDRDEDGRFRQRYPDEAFLGAVRELEVASTQNVADEVGCSYDLAYRRLQTLEDDGEVRQDQVGSSFLWLPA